MSVCKESIEALFVTITNTPEPMTVGVVYRPPNSSLEEFNRNYEQILSELSDKKAFILGDFNINLLQATPSSLEDRFQETTFGCGFSPTIAIPTHQMPHCARTCIDNIHSNDIDSTITTGVIIEKISHHHPVFLIKNFQATLHRNREHHRKRSPYIMITVTLT